MALTYYPMQDNYKTKLARAWDWATWTVYVTAAPEFTMPANSYTFITVDPWTSKEQVFICDSFNTTNKTLNAYSVTVNKWPWLPYTQQTHSVGAKVIISDCYANWEAMKTAIDTAGTNPVASTTTRWWVVLPTTAIAKAGTDTNWSWDPYTIQPSQVLDIVNDNIGSDIVANMIISTTRAWGAETISLKTLAWTDPSATDPIKVAFRNSTLGTGDFTVLTLTSATSITIPSTATMWASNNVAFRLWLVWFNDWGTFRLWVVNTCVSWSIFSFSPELLTSSTIMDTTSDSAWVFYTGTAVTSKAYRILWYLDYTLATAGTRWTAPTKIQLFWPWVKRPWDILQIQFTSTWAVATGTTRTPWDDTIPAITEWDQYMSLTITPTYAQSKLNISSVATFTNSSADNNTVALHQAWVTDALAVVAGVNWALNMISPHIDYIGNAWTTSSTAYSIRIWSTTWTITFNGSWWARKYWGAALSRMKITEFMV